MIKMRLTIYFKEDKKHLGKSYLYYDAKKITHKTDDTKNEYLEILYGNYKQDLIDKDDIKELKLELL